MYNYRIMRIPEGHDRKIEVQKGQSWVLAAIIFNDDHVLPVSSNFAKDVNRILYPSGPVAQVVRCERCGKWLKRAASMSGGLGLECRNKVYCKI